MTPGPAGMAAADPANPQTWNMYAYVADNPTTLNDPSGLLPLGPPGAGDGDGCSAQNAPGDCPKAHKQSGIGAAIRGWLGSHPVAAALLGYYGVVGSSGGPGEGAKRKMADSHQAPDGTGQYFRVMFPLERDRDGYPPVENEVLWAKETGPATFRLDNIPFYARGVSCGDVVAAESLDRGPLRFRAVVEPSLHSTIRVFLPEDSPDHRPLHERTADLRGKLKALGCDTEANRPGFFAIDVPPSVKLSAVRAILAPGSEAGFWDYEEATLWHAG